MGKKTIVFFASAVMWLAVLYQWIGRDILFVTLGVGRKHQKIQEFPYTCTRLKSPLLEGCEDMVLDEEGRRLYAACASLESRKGWSPGGNAYNTSARDFTGHVSFLDVDRVSALGIDGLPSDRNYVRQKLEITGDYLSATGGKDIDPLGIEIEVISGSRIRFWIVNERPFVDEKGNYLDAKKLGANYTIEVFELTRGSNKLEFVKTFVDDAIFSPNNIASTGNGSVFITNDHATKVGILRNLEIIVGTGSVTYCSLAEGSCHMAATEDFHYANGIIKSPSLHNVVYVAHSSKGYITTHIIGPNNTLGANHEPIPIGMAVDNLSRDSNGDIFVAGFPNPLALRKASQTPDNVDIPSAVFRIRMAVEGDGSLTHAVEKVLEDADGEVLPGSTIAVHDVQTDTFWMGGIMSRYITVCQHKDQAFQEAT